MNNLDRYLRVIYKDCDIASIFNAYVDDNWSQLFRLDDNEKAINYKRKIYRDYQWCYPYNYNQETIATMLDFYLNKARTCEDANHVSKYADFIENSNDVLALLACAVEETLDVKEDKVVVKDNMLWEWDGIFNKVDTNVLTSLKCVINKTSIEAQETSNICLAVNLAEGIAENHMHLKGSGYTTEMNIAAILDMKLTSAETISKTCTGATFDEKLLGEVPEIFDSYIHKIKMLKLFLYDLMNDKLLSNEERVRLIKDRYCYIYEPYKTKLSRIENSIANNGDYYANGINSEAKRYFVGIRIFMAKAFEHICNGESSGEFNFLLTTYIIGLTKIRFLFVQDNFGTGFCRFKKYDERKKAFIGNIELKDSDIYASVFDKYGKEETIRKIEFRIAPPGSSKDFNKLITALLKARKESECGNSIKFGIIVHFIKPNAKEDMAVEPLCARYEKYLDILEKRASVLESIIESSSNSKYIVGIDAANYEIDCPPEVFGGIYSKFGTKGNYPHIKKTYHVGEDFRTILTGIRRVSEAIYYLRLRKKDRLGHALAVGLDVDKYFENARNVISTTYQEYCDDLAWMNHIIEYEKRCKGEVDQKILLYQNEIEKEFNEKLTEIVKGTAIGSKIVIEKYY